MRLILNTINTDSTSKYINRLYTIMITKCINYVVISRSETLCKNSKTVCCRHGSLGLEFCTLDSIFGHEEFYTILKMFINNPWIMALRVLNTWKHFLQFNPEATVLNQIHGLKVTLCDMACIYHSVSWGITDTTKVRSDVSGGWAFPFPNISNHGEWRNCIIKYRLSFIIIYFAIGTVWENILFQLLHTNNAKCLVHQLRHKDPNKLSVPLLWMSRVAFVVWLTIKAPDRNRTWRMPLTSSRAK